MGDDALRPPLPPKRRPGCLKWTCGCVAIAAFLCLAGVIAGGYFFSRWTPGRSAWERLPADTAFAFEAHDVAALMKTISDDPGAASLGGAFLRWGGSLLAEQGVRMEEGAAEALRAWSGQPSWLHTLLFPNYALFGMGGPAGGRAFFILQPPRWFAWMAGLSAGGGAVLEIAEGGMTAFLAFRDGFVIVAPERAAVEHVLNNWNAAAAPFGKGAGRADPYVMLAARGGGGETAERDAAAGPFLSGGLADGFAAREPFAPPAPTGAKASGLRAQTLVLPDELGWRIRFELVDADAPAAASFEKRIDDAVGADALEVSLPDASDLEIAVSPSKSILERQRLPGGWLNGLLEGAGGAFSLLASRPVAGEDAPYPPLPVVSFGWELSPARAPEETAARFADALARSLEAIRAGGGAFPPGVARSLVSAETAEDRLSGSISLPPVIVNGARPAWKFLPRTSPPMGWLATDPSGLPREALVERLAARTLPPPGDGTLVVAANWDMSRVFIDALAAVAEDRLSQIPEEWFADLPGGKESLSPGIRAARLLFTAYPRGTVRASVHAEQRATRGRAFIPFGMGVEF